MSNALLYEAEGLSRTFFEAGRDVEVLKGISFAIPRNTLVAVCGPSGAGKSTLLHILGLLDRGYRGTLSMQGELLSRLNERDATRYRLERVGLVFQRHHVVDAMTVLENVAWPGWRLDGNPRQAFSKARQLLGEFGLADRMSHHPAKLSGGELQRVALARALINRPSVLLADEPTAQLDEPNARQIIETLRALREQGHSIVVVTHDPHLANAADLRVNLQYGRIVELQEKHDAQSV